MTTYHNWLKIGKMLKKLMRCLLLTMCLKRRPIVARVRLLATARDAAGRRRGSSVATSCSATNVIPVRHLHGKEDGMALVIQYHGPYATPQVTCDHCGELITDATEGNYQWSHPAIVEGPTTPIYFTHKACCVAFEQAQGGDWGAIGLECLPFYLVKNLHTSWRAAEASGRLMSR
jgi:hypothetical protein